MLKIAAILMEGSGGKWWADGVGCVEMAPGNATWMLTFPFIHSAKLADGTNMILSDHL